MRKDIEIELPKDMTMRQLSNFIYSKEIKKCNLKVYKNKVCLKVGYVEVPDIQI